MAEYRKYMFDNFVISAERPQEEPEAEPVSDEPEAEAELEEEKSAEPVVEEPVVEEPVAPAPPEVLYSREELQAAEHLAEEKGYERGYYTAISEKEKAENLLLDSINNRLMTILSEVGAQTAEQEQSLLRFAVSLVRKLLPSLEEEVALKEVEAFISDNFKNFAKEGILSFRFHPDMVSKIAPKISRLAEKNDFSGRIAVHKDENLGLSDCKIEWNNGGVERNMEQTLSRVEDLLQN